MANLLLDLVISLSSFTFALLGIFIIVYVSRLQYEPREDEPSTGAVYFSIVVGSFLFAFGLCFTLVSLLKFVVDLLY